MEQLQYKQRFKTFYDQRFLDEKTINGMMKLNLHHLDEQKQMIVIKLDVEAWQLNPVKMLHGGIMATLLDVSMGCVAYVFSDAYFTPTVSLSINYVRSVCQDEQVVVYAYVDYIGKNIIQTRSIAYVNDEVVASANGSYTIYRK